MATQTHPPPTAPAALPSAGRAWRTGLIITGTALVANTVVLAAARMAGADMIVQRDAATAVTIGVGSVALMTALPIMLATILLLALRRRAARAWGALAVMGLLVGLVTAPVPLAVTAEASTSTALALMHLTTGVVWFVVVRRAATRRGEA